MSLKSIEMQIALPRSIDAAKLQDQLLQRGQLQNDQASLKMHQEEVKQRITVVKQEQKENASFNQNSGQGQSYYHGQQEKQSKQKSEGKHPYKGNFLDFSG